MDPAQHVSTISVTPPPTAGRTMQAVVRHSYGSADVLHLARVSRPQIAAREVLVQVRAAGLDRGTWHQMTGRPYLARLAFGLRRPKRPVLGLDFAGTVVALGPSVTRFAVGDAVFGFGRGSFAEYVAAPEDKVAHKPASLSFEQAAVVPVSGLTAIRALHDSGRVAAGQRVLIVGASGGVGTYAVQIAASLGAHVTAVSSATKADLVRSLGAERVIDYAREDFAEGSPGYDLILDIGGNASLSRLRRALAPKGTLVLVGGEGGGPVTGGIDRQLRASVLSLFVRQRLTMLVPKENHTDLERLAELVDAGDVTPSIDRSYPLAGVPDAMRHLVAGNARGKVAITL